MRGFFKIFFATLLALIIFVVVIVIVLIGVAGTVLSPEKPEIGSKAVLSSIWVSLIKRWCRTIRCPV
jgi:protease-4